MEQNPRTRRPRPHAARRARFVTGVASVAATIGLTSYMAVGYAAPASTTVASATSTGVTATATQSKTSSAGQSYSSSAAQPSAVSSQTQTQSSGS